MQFGRSFLFCAPGPSPNSLKGWSERGDLNSRPPVPQTGALTELRYAPTLEIKYLVATALATDGELPTVCPPH